MRIKKLSLIASLFLSFFLGFLQSVDALPEIDQSEKLMKIVICSYNNAEWYKDNIDSVVEQDYINWHIIYVDDCSSDNTAELVSAYVKKLGIESQVTMIANAERRGALANHYTATHLCDDWDIVCQLDGDDWFAHDHVLSDLNALYQDSAVWLTYGSFIDWPTDKMGYCKPVPQNVIDDRLYRETYWAPGQLRTFYAWVFKKIKLEDLIWDHEDKSRGKFYPASCDLAFSYPMMEMVGEHFLYVDDVNYVHNVATALNDFKVNRVPQIIASNILLYKRKYDPVTVTPPLITPPAQNVDVMIISYAGFDNCDDTLNSLLENVTGINNIYIIDVVAKRIGQYQDGGIIVLERDYKTVQQLLVKELYRWWESCDYVLLVQNGMQAYEPFDLVAVSSCLKATKAFGFFPSLGVVNDPLAPYVTLQDDICAWRLWYSDESWLQGESCLCVLAHKKDLRARIAYLNERLVEESFLRDLRAPGMLLIKDPSITRMGLCFKTAKLF